MIHLQASTNCESLSLLIDICLNPATWVKILHNRLYRCNCPSGCISCKIRPRSHSLVDTWFLSLHLSRTDLRIGFCISASSFIHLASALAYFLFRLHFYRIVHLCAYSCLHALAQVYHSRTASCFSCS